ncbi:acyl-CoA dehydrogenase family protein [Streptomyces sp. NPDC102365]|uniref:acyl-CoA dehydrogenase family protein n=1 Tax=Streptomyces sp. NPDC102365 TaxID=3366162 RepID=UPI0037FD35E7
MATRSTDGASVHLLDAARTAAKQAGVEAAATEQDRRITGVSAAAARAAGAFALGVPRSEGGIEAGLSTRVRFLAELGRGCPSTAWVAATTLEAKRVLHLTIDRDWHMAGLGGTGSHTLVGDDVWIPDSHRLDLPRIAAAPSNIPIAVGLFAPLWGAARGALDIVVDVLAQRTSPNRAHPTPADSPGTRTNLAVAAHKIDSAERRMPGIAAVVDATQPGEVLAATERARLRMDLIAAVRECRGALEDLLDLHGSSGLDSSNPLQRYWRDFAVGSRHVQFTFHVVEDDYGVLLLDIDEAPSGLL